MKINHTIYGIILFLSLLVLIYLLKTNTNNTTEYFQDPPPPSPTLSSFTNQINNDYIIYEKSYFNLDNVLNDKTLKECLTICNKNKKCKGITIDSSIKIDNIDTDTNIYKCYMITDTDTCYSNLQGSGIQRSDAENYTSYLKKSTASSSKLCLTTENMGKTFTINNQNDIYWCLNNNQLYGIDKNKIEFDKLYDNTKFKIVAGLYGSGTISFQLLNLNNMYLTHNFPRDKKIVLKQLTDSSSQDFKKNASFRMVSGLSNKGYSIKILNFPNMYFKINGSKHMNEIIIETIESKNNKELNNASTFFLSDELVVIKNEELHNFNADYAEDIEDENNSVPSFTQEDKIKRMKNKNINTLDRQNLMLENQNKQINNLEFLHINNISKIGREFANQSARLALGKYIKEKQTIDLLKENKPIKPGENIPSIDTIRAQK
jgi:hypothetical protein